MIKCKLAECGKFDRCCCLCPEKDDCTQYCGDHYDLCGKAEFTEEETSVEVFTERHAVVLRKIADIVTQKKALEATEKELKDKLKEAMEAYNVKKFSSDILDITYVPDGTRSSIDTAKLKKLHPDIAAQCTKVSKTSAYIKVTVKDGEGR